MLVKERWVVKEMERFAFVSSPSLLLAMISTVNVMNVIA